MHNDLTKANLNAWHYWWMYCANNSGCLYDTGTKVWTKRLWAMGNFSRFVRPGWKRVATSGTSPSGVLVSAYINPANNALSIVAINSNTSSKSVSFYVSGNAPVLAHALRDVGQQEPGPGLCRHRLGVPSDGDALRPERDDLRRNAVELAKGWSSESFR